MSINRYHPDHYPISGKENNIAEINKNRKDRVEKYILDINNKLCELAEFMFLDIRDELNNDTIQKVKESQNKEKFKGVHFGDIGKKAIIDEVLSRERQEEIRKASVAAAGITMEEPSRTAKEVADQLKQPISKGTPPPKTDWKREKVSYFEKEKIINSLRANPKSNVFSKEFKWQPEEFLEAFKYLESSEKYNGQFIVSVVDNKLELEKYSEIKDLSKGIDEMYFGKYVLLSMYDIAATSGYDTESKHIYIGLKYISMVGRLEFDCLGSIESGISNSQKLSIKEYLDSMDILYDEDDEYLKIQI